MVAKTRAEMRVQRMEDRVEKTEEIITKNLQAGTVREMIGEQAGQAGAAMNLLKMILDEMLTLVSDELNSLQDEVRLARAALKEDQRRRKKEAIPKETAPTETVTGEMDEGVHSSTTEGANYVPEA